jgi:alanine racemase
VRARGARAGASGLAVVCVDEGEELRQAGIGEPILVVGYTPPSDAERIVALRLRPTVGAPELVEALAQAARRAGWTVPLHLELESGLNRHGLPADRLVALAERARAVAGVEVEGVFTHFAAAEEGDQRFTRRQFDVLREVSARLPFVKERHCSASASVLLDGGWRSTRSGPASPCTGTARRAVVRHRRGPAPRPLAARARGACSTSSAARP